MAYQALYRKYRPNSFKDFIDQESICEILINSIKNDTISHAYLFSGPRGIGKTSMAKIFAKAINCSDFSIHNDVCNKCENCVDVDNQSVDIIEIDAASNNGVDQIRELKNKVSIVPSNLKYKVYIIDEVHMLTNSAFNALLKTLEEPPSYVVFILATTEFYEVPETIVSRCQCFNFERISLNSLVKRLRYISDTEKILIDDDALLEIAAYANGGLRDAISMLDKIRSFSTDRITLDVFKNINGMISQKEIEEFYTALLDKNIPFIIKSLNHINNDGYDFKNFIERLMIYVRDKIINYYVNKEPITGDINNNINMVFVFNDILNKLKDAVNPLIIVQVYILKLISDCNLDNGDKVVNSQKEEKNISRAIKLPELNDKKNISQEINTIQKDDKIINNQNKKSNSNPLKSGLLVDENIKNIRINNAMATANIKYKNELTDIWKKLDEYFINDKFGRVAQLLSDTIPMVVGSDYLILTTNSDGIINNVYKNINTTEDLIKNIYREMKIVIISQNEFEKVKTKYIEDKKNNIAYILQEENGKLVIENNNLINQALDVFGADMVEIE